ncbi:hypothetical protein C8R45DRAFT_999635 [Mycena sanguinolenta]|nr:hypothetical protein C8R45DRAFT_999635 [Mycena sanguinolenta]
MTVGLSHPELNAKAGELFHAGDFAGAAEYYELATHAAADTVPVYLSNLAATYLKLRKYRAAEQAADKALRLEPRAIKPRYRRAVARKNLNLISEALIDLASVLTTDPRNLEAQAKFQTLLTMQNERDKTKRTLVPGAILEADSPSAHGSFANPPRPTDPDRHLRGLPYFQWIQPTPPVNVGGIHGACYVCNKTMHRRNLKECQKCRRVNYCSVSCQRVDWPEHRRTCNVAPDEYLAFRAGRGLTEHEYFHLHLLLYALRAMGPAKLAHQPRDRILMAVIDMVPVSAAKPAGRKRMTVTNILTVPTSVTPPGVQSLLHSALQTAGEHAVHGVWIVTAGSHPKPGEETRFRVSLLVPDNLISSYMHLPQFSLDFFSHSYGVHRRVNLDMDFLFESINDELRLDKENFYQLQV